MNEAVLRLADRAEELRDAFDRSFVAPARIEEAAAADLLAIRIGSEACALRLTDIAGLFADKKITRVPGRAAALLGIAGFRGAVMPVYDLAALLGYPMAKMPRWLAMASAAPVAFAFEAFDGHRRLTRDALVRPETDDHARKYVSEMVRMDDIVRAIVDLPAILQAISTQRPQPSPTKEP